jgi:hypothetical protein
VVSVYTRECKEMKYQSIGTGLGSGLFIGSVFEDFHILFYRTAPCSSYWNFPQEQIQNGTDNERSPHSP